VGGEGFEPSKAMPSDLQSDPFDRSGNPPSLALNLVETTGLTQVQPASSAKNMGRSAPRGSAIQTKISLVTYMEPAEGLEPTTC
jgi:hypothetical protein